MRTSVHVQVYGSRCEIQFKHLGVTPGQLAPRLYFEMNQAFCAVGMLGGGWFLWLVVASQKPGFRRVPVWQHGCPPLLGADVPLCPWKHEGSERLLLWETTTALNPGLPQAPCSYGGRRQLWAGNVLSLSLVLTLQGNWQLHRPKSRTRLGLMLDWSQVYGWTSLHCW